MQKQKTMQKIQKISLPTAVEAVEGFWNPMVVGELNGQQLKIARFKGAFDWHHHENEDECFLVIGGRLKICLRAGDDIELSEGEFVVIPRGVEHKPVAEEEAQVLLFEPNSTVNTGNLETPRTRRILKRFEPGQE
jgi:quercetin dioxygenase-like cupin family protein